ncbi:MAG: hypothetical protein K0S05_1833 [Agromyces sp.]|jgi:hypothetical protein|nr:hypothetical protein [Agromyces sp.]
MRIARSGRFVYVAHWPAAVVLPLFFVVGRGLVGSELGFMVVIGMVFAPLAIVVLLVPPVLTQFDRESRRAYATRLGYDVASFVLWGACVLAALSVEDSFGFAGARSALSVWLGISSADSEAVFGAAVVVMGASYVAAVLLAIRGVARGRDRALTDASIPA